MLSGRVATQFTAPHLLPPQGLDEVKLLQYVNAADPHDESGLLRLYDFFYFKVIVFI